MELLGGRMEGEAGSLTWPSLLFPVSVNQALSSICNSRSRR